MANAIIINDTTPSTTTVYSSSKVQTELNLIAICIRDFGAHSIDEAGYSTFNSSTAINNAIAYAVSNKYNAINFGSGRFYAADITLANGLTYFSIEGAELITVAKTPVNHSLMGGSNVSNVTIKGLNLNGNIANVGGDSSSGVNLISFFSSTNITICECYLHDNNYLGILLAGCNGVRISENIIYNTDCGIETMGGATNHMLIYNNQIYGGTNQNSEPIAIFNDTSLGLAHDIIITSNVIHDKSNASGIFISNAKDVTISNNTVYNCANGISTDNSAFHIIITNNIVRDTGSGGINVSSGDSIVSSNIITNTQGTAMALSNINRGIVFGNIITDFNTGNVSGSGIYLFNAIDVTVDNNQIYDTRETIKAYSNIEMGGTSNRNLIQNHSKFGMTTTKVDIIVNSGVNNTTFRNNTMDVINQGLGTKAFYCTKKSSPNSGWLDNTGGVMHLGLESDMFYVDNPSKITKCDGATWDNRIINIIFKVTTATLVSNSVFSLHGNFTPTLVGDSITLYYSGSKWFEMSRSTAS